MAILAYPQAGKAERNPQFPEQSALLAGHLAGLDKAIFGRLAGPIRVLQEQNFAFDAEQFRDIPHLTILALAGGCHRVFQGAKPLIEPPESSKRQRESALELRIR